MHLLTEHEVAAALRVSVATLRKWRWQGGGIGFKKIGRRAVRYDSDELRAYLERASRLSTSDGGR